MQLLNALKRRIFALLKPVGRFIDAHEKVILAGLAVIIIVSGTWWFRQFSKNTNPSVGGTFVEAVVRDADELSQLTIRLTKSGLFRFNEQGEVVNQLVSSWSVNADKTEYRFKLLPEIDPASIISQADQNASVLDQPLVSENNGEIVFEMPEPSPSLPLLLTEPIFDYGPYKSQKATEVTAIFVRRSESWASPAFVNKVIIQIVDTAEKRDQLLAKSKIDGYIGKNLPADVEKTAFPLKFPRFYGVIFNINKAPFRDANIRKGVTAGRADKPVSFTLTTVDKEPQRTLATRLVSEWQVAGIKAEVKYVSLDDMRDKVIAPRDFQAVLTGIDYGAEMDPYFLWHSSQIRPPGANYSGIKSPTVDGLIVQTRESLNANTRMDLIKQLHQELQSEGVALILSQDSTNLYLSDRVKAAQAPIVNTDYDHLLGLRFWSMK